MAYINVFIDIDEFYRDLNRQEIIELIGFLKEDGYLKQSELIPYDSEEVDGNPLDHAWVEMLQKIHTSRYQLTPEEETQLINIAKRL